MFTSSWLGARCKSSGRPITHCDSAGYDLLPPAIPASALVDQFDGARRVRQLSRPGLWYNRGAGVKIRKDLWRVTIFGTSTINAHTATIDKPTRTLLFHTLAHDA